MASQQTNQVIPHIETLIDTVEDLQNGVFKPQKLEILVRRPDDIGDLSRSIFSLGHEVHSWDNRVRLLRLVVLVGSALSMEQDFDLLLEKIVLEAKRFTNADGGTLYLLRDDEKLQPVILRNDSLDIEIGGKHGSRMPFDPLPLYDDEGRPNHHSVSTYVALQGSQINIPDIYTVEGFDFSVAKQFDKENNYRSKSFLTIPLKSQNNEVIGVLQLINAMDPQDGQTIPFYPDDVLNALVTLASAALIRYKREEALRKEIEHLRVQVDLVRRDSQVAEITDTDYFRYLQARAKELREKRQTAIQLNQAQDKLVLCPWLMM